MTQATNDIERGEQMIASLLLHGTWIASMIISLGIAIGIECNSHQVLFSQSGHALVKAGVVIFILLPVARVILMFGVFIRNKDYLYTALSAFVLAIISIGVLAGL